MTALLTLTHGRHALVDDVDFDQASAISWTTNSRGYVYGWVGGRMVRLHRFLLHAPDGVHVDHVNGDKLDNRRANIRLCTRSQNAANSRIFPDRSSGLRGVRQIRSLRYAARIRVHGRRFHLGVFDSAEDAARAYDAAARKAFGEFARPNFGDGS